MNNFLRACRTKNEIGHTYDIPINKRNITKGWVRVRVF